MSASVTRSPVERPSYSPAEAAAEPAPLLLTVPQVAASLRFSRARVYELVAAGVIPSIKIGRSRRIRVAALAAYLDGLADGATSGDAA